MNLDPEIFSISLGQHNNKNVIWIRFAYQKNYTDILRKALPDAKWSQ